MHIYAFGSVCRGEVTIDSDVDLLALVDRHEDALNPTTYSIYSYSKMTSMWVRGSPFAWHLHIESRLLFTPDGVDFLRSLGEPGKYEAFLDDCEKFRTVYEIALISLKASDSSQVFDLSSMFLAIRNIATCFSLGVGNIPCFSRHAGLLLKDNPVPLTVESYKVLERSRVLCTRSVGGPIGPEEAQDVLKESEAVSLWMQDLVEKARRYERVQQ